MQYHQGAENNCFGKFLFQLPTLSTCEIEALVEESIFSVKFKYLYTLSFSLRITYLIFLFAFIDILLCPPGKKIDD